MPGRITEQYTYQIGNISFIVSPVYPENPSGETVSDILLKLMCAEAEGILYRDSGQRYHISGNTDCLTAGKRSN